MKLYIAIEVKPQKWVHDDTVYQCHGSTMAYPDRKKLEEIISIHKSVKYQIVEIEVTDETK